MSAKKMQYAEPSGKLEDLRDKNIQLKKRKTDMETEIRVMSTQVERMVG